MIQYQMVHNGMDVKKIIKFVAYAGLCLVLVIFLGFQFCAKPLIEQQDELMEMADRFSAKVVRCFYEEPAFSCQQEYFTEEAIKATPIENLEVFISKYISALGARNSTVMLNDTFSYKKMTSNGRTTTQISFQTRSNYENETGVVEEFILIKENEQFRVLRFHVNSTEIFK